MENKLGSLVLVTLLNIGALIGSWAEYAELSTNPIIIIIFILLFLIFVVGEVLEYLNKKKAFLIFSIYYFAFSAISSINIFQRTNSISQNLVLILLPFFSLITLICDSKSFKNFFFKYSIEKLKVAVILLILVFLALRFYLYGEMNELARLFFIMFEFGVFFYMLTLLIAQVFGYFKHDFKKVN